MDPNRRETRRTAALREIREVAWKQIGEVGAAQLSMRAIAREMGVTAPALYRYYKDRDALVAALLIESFTDFSQAIETGGDAYPVTNYAGRFRAMCRAYFQWAMQNPQRYTLLFSTPVPGYLFADELGPVAQRSFLILQGMIGEAQKAGKLTGELANRRLAPALSSQYDMLRKMGMPYTSAATHLALSVWSMLHGMASLYLQGYLSGFLPQSVDAFVEFEIDKLARMLGLT